MLKSPQPISVLFRAVGLVFPLAPSGAQKAIELFAQFEKFGSVLLHRNARAELLNAFTFRLVHASGSIAARGRWSMFGVERRWRIPSFKLGFKTPEARLLSLPSFGSYGRRRKHFSEASDVLAEKIPELPVNLF
jgi:hypothetical protein